MPGLLETAASLGLSAGVVALVMANLAGAARTQAACLHLADDLFRARQLEHLVDRATLLAGAGPTRPPPLSSLSGDTAVFAADLDGDGAVDPNSSETSAVEVRPDGADTRVRLRLGRQTMTVLEAEGSEATLAAFDRRGMATDAATASLVELVLAARDEVGDQAPRRMLFALPARTLP